MSEAVASENGTPAAAAPEPAPVTPSGPPAGSKGVRAYDFRRPKHLAAEQMKNIHRVHATIADAVRERLTRYLSVNLDVRMESAEELAYGLFVESVPEYAYANLLDLSPLQDRGLLLIEAQLCLAFVDRILGGRSKTPPRPRPLTAIDQAAAESAVEMILRCLREGWKDFCPAKMTVVERRADLGQVRLVPTGEPVLAVTLAVTGDVGEGRIKLVVPVGGLKTIIEGTASRGAAVRPGPEKATAIRNNLMRSMERAALPVVGTVGSAEISIRNLMRLSAGDIVRLDQPAAGPVLLSVGGKPAFLGRMGLRGRCKAVQIMEPLDPKEEE